MSARDYIRMETMYREYRTQMRQKEQSEIHVLETPEGFLLIKEVEKEEQS